VWREALERTAEIYLKGVPSLGINLGGFSFRLDQDHAALMGAQVRGVAEELSKEVNRR